MTKVEESIKFIRLLGENGKYYSLAQYKWANEWDDKMVEELESIIGGTLLSS